MLFSFPFSISPYPLVAGSLLLAGLNQSPAPGVWDVRTGDRFAAAGGMVICLFLIVSCRSLRLRSFAFVLPVARVFLSCLVFSCLPGRVLFACRRVPSSLRPVFPVPCVSCFVLVSRPRLICLVRSARRSLPACPRLGDSVAVPCHPVGAVACFAPSASAFRLSSPLRLVLSARLVSCPRLAVPRLGRRSACFDHLGPMRFSCRSCSRSVLLPALLVVGRGDN